MATGDDFKGGLGAGAARADVAKLLAGWQTLERLRGRALLRTERQAIREVQETVRRVVGTTADRLESLSAPTRLNRALTLSAIHSAASQLQAELTTVLTEARSDARTASLERATAEVEKLANQLRRDGWEGTDLPTAPTPSDATPDALAARATASSLTGRWSSAALAAALKWEADGNGSPASPIRRTATALAPSIDRAVVTEVAAAFNDEALAALEPLSDYPWSAGMFKVWSGMLDGRICQRCYEMDGRAVPTDEPWPAGAYMPMHPWCRCTAVPLYIPKPRALQDVASDYASYKQEIRDQIRESRGQRSFGRTAGEFVARSRVGRSPVVISKDFAAGRLRRTGS